MGCFIYLHRIVIKICNVRNISRVFWYFNYRGEMIIHNARCYDIRQYVGGWKIFYNEGILDVKWYFTIEVKWYLSMYGAHKFYLKIGRLNLYSSNLTVIRIKFEPSWAKPNSSLVGLELNPIHEKPSSSFTNQENGYSSSSSPASSAWLCSTSPLLIGTTRPDAWEGERLPRKSEEKT